MKARHLLTIKACRDTKGEHSGCLQPTVTASETAFSGINSPDLPQREKGGVRCWGSELRTIQAIAYAQQTPSCLLEHCPAFE